MLGAAEQRVRGVCHDCDWQGEAHSVYATAAIEALGHEAEATQ